MIICYSSNQRLVKQKKSEQEMDCSKRDCEIPLEGENGMGCN